VHAYRVLQVKISPIRPDRAISRFFWW